MLQMRSSIFDFFLKHSMRSKGNIIDSARTGTLVAALGFFLIGAVLKTMQASRSRAANRSLKRA